MVVRDYNKLAFRHNACALCEAPAPSPVDMLRVQKDSTSFFHWTWKIFTGFTQHTLFCSLSKANPLSFWLGDGGWLMIVLLGINRRFFLLSAVHCPSDTMPII